MSDFPWNTKYSPRPGAAQRLTDRLLEADHEQFQETRLWQTIATVLVIGAIWTGTRYFPTGVSIEEGANDRIKMAEVPGTPKGIHYYWVFSASEN